MYAAKQGHLNVVKTLVGNKHADVNIAEKVGSSTLVIEI
jgi:hypothetical protein